MDTEKGFSTQTALLRAFEKWKAALDNRYFTRGILIDLPKVFDTINHELLIAKHMVMVLTKTY